MQLKVRELGRQDIDKDVMDVVKDMAGEEFPSTYNAREWTFTMNDREVFEILITLLKDKLPPGVPITLAIPLLVGVLGGPDNLLDEAVLALVKTCPFAGMVLAEKRRLDFTPTV